MPKEWILNSATNRFQLNFKRNVGAVSEAIRKCSPERLSEWKKYYFSKVKSKKDIEELGKKLYVKITEVVSAEIDEVTEKDCVDYLYDLVISRTYDGYLTEIRTIYGQLKEELRVQISPAPDEWDRKYNVDFFIEIKKRCIGLQIKPVNGVSHIPQIYKEKKIQKRAHEKFEEGFWREGFLRFFYEKAQCEKNCES